MERVLSVVARMQAGARVGTVAQVPCARDVENDWLRKCTYLSHNRERWRTQHIGIMLVVAVAVPLEDLFVIGVNEAVELRIWKQACTKEIIVRQRKDEEDISIPALARISSRLVDIAGSGCR
jgi:hypothetical protein